MTSHPFVSRAPRAEDVLLARALDGHPLPRYLEVLSSTTSGRCRSLDEHGWTGTTVTTADAAELPTDEPVHALVVDPGAEAAVVPAITAGSLRPWVALAPSVRADAAGSPLVTALLDAGYVPALFDGASLYLVHPEQGEIAARLDHPAGPDDAYVTEEVDQLTQQVAELTRRQRELDEELASWRARTIENWSEVAATQRLDSPAVEADRLQGELDAMRATISWRVTAPLRLVRGFKSSRSH